MAKATAGPHGGSDIIELSDVADIQAFAFYGRELFRLPVDTIIVSVGASGLGGVGYAVQDECPDEPWQRLDLSTVTVGAPGQLILSKQPPRWKTLRRVVLATIREYEASPGRGARAELQPTADSISRATRSAIMLAGELGCESLALPLMGTGVAGFPLQEGADVATRAAYDTLLTYGVKLGIRSVYWVSSDLTVAEQTASGWNSAAAGKVQQGDRSAVPTGSAEPASKPSRSGRAPAEAPEEAVQAAREDVPAAGDAPVEAEDSIEVEAPAGDAEVPSESAGSPDLTHEADPATAESATVDRPSANLDRVQDRLDPPWSPAVRQAAALASVWDGSFDADTDPAGDVVPALVALACLEVARTETGPETSVVGELIRALARDPSRSTADRLDVARRLLRSRSVLPDPPDLDAAWTGGVTDFLVLAEESARARLGQVDTIGLEHLLGCAAAPPRQLDGAVVGEEGISAEDLRRMLRAAVLTAAPNAPVQRWDEWLGLPVEQDQLAGGVSDDLVDAEQGIPLADDHLGVANYVTMLATLVARKDTPLPLSIGLFGEWGSGKSYFMGLLRQQIRDLARLDSDVYHKDVVQIGFNAWHYADSNLWASLGDAIFEQLAGPKATDKKRRDQLKKELAEKLQAKDELAAAGKLARVQSQALQEELSVRRRERVQSVSALARAAAKSFELDKIWKTLGVSDQVRQGEILIDEVDGTEREWNVVRTTLTGRTGRALAWFVFAVLLVVGVTAVLSVFSDQVRGYLGAIGLAGITSVLATASFLAARVRSAITSLADTAAEVRMNLATEAEGNLRHEFAALRKAEANEELIAAQLESNQSQITAIEQELAELAPGNRLYGFINARNSSGEYRAQLSLISTIRRDFEELISLMKAWRKERGKDTDGGRTPIDRIVLYIDDLDRCSPKQVVDVLQAVHLLLALDLFVVVVGVDPRWLLHSLRGEYRGLLSADKITISPTEERSDEDELDELAWRTTPQNYLEKIFNIPFVLPKPTASTFEQLVRSIAFPKHRDDSADEEPELDDADDTSTLDSQDTPDAPQSNVAPRSAAGSDLRDSAGPGSTMPTPADPSRGASIPVEEDSEIAQQRAAQRESGQRIEAKPLTEDELKLLGLLWRLVETPRQTKRLLNLYRMLRSTSNLTAEAGFLGTPEHPGDYEAVVLLLGILTSRPTLLGEVLAAPVDADQDMLGGLCHRDGGASWQEFVEGCRPRKVERDDADDEAKADIGTVWRNDLDPQLSQARREEWDALLDEITPALAQASRGRTLVAFQRWGPRVARFSFVLSPLAASVESLPASIPPAHATPVS